MRIQLDIQNVYAYVDSLSTNSVNSTVSYLPDLIKLLYHDKDKLWSHV